MDGFNKFIDENIGQILYDWWYHQKCTELCKAIEKDEDILKAEYDHRCKTINVHKRGKIHNLETTITLSK